jgi:hypothetical protein
MQLILNAGNVAVQTKWYLHPASIRVTFKLLNSGPSNARTCVCVCVCVCVNTLRQKQQVQLSVPMSMKTPKKMFTCGEGSLALHSREKKKKTALFDDSKAW